MASSIFKYVFMDFFKPMLQLLLFVFPAFYTAVFSLLVFFAFVVFLGRNPQPATFVFDPQVIAIADPRSVPADHANASGLPFPAPPHANTSLGVRRKASPENASDLAPASANHSAEAKKGRGGSPEKGQKALESSKDLAATCDLFDGRWVFDESTPRYPPGSCPFIDSSFDCFGNGRPDQNYTKLRWKPKGCSIPRLEGKKMLRALRGKRLVFVGDSLNRNMWESLLCILRHPLKRKHRVFEVSGRKEFRTDNSFAFRFEDYNCSIEFFRSPFLVRESSRVDSQGKSRETLRLDLIEASSDAYRTADILVFNSGHWWTHEKTSKGRNFYQEGDHVYPQLSAEDAYRKAMRTWGTWVDTQVNSNSTRVFFRGYSWSHFSGGQWNSGGNCDGETEPITEDKHLAKYLKLTGILESVIGEMTTPILYLNITRMTDYRKDAHPSVYRVPAGKRKPGEFQDCSHWCLPGVPDAWNELLYAMLLRELS
ncbi:unnamed protein product [Musa banksii]